MANKIARCHICGIFFQSKKKLKDHKGKSHRITDSKIIVRKEPIDHNRV
jgi:uncharacterized C2H2 Zn-finger protein